MKTILIDDSILFYLIYKNSLRDQIIQTLMDWIKNHNIILSNVYAFFKIYQLFYQSNRVKQYYEFYQDCSEFITTIYSISDLIFKNALSNSIVYQINFDLCIHLESIKETKTQNFFSLTPTKKEIQIIKQHYGIEVIQI